MRDCSGRLRDDGGLDIESPPALLAYLRAAGRIAADEMPRIEVLSGGVSNRTVLVERPGGEAWVLKQALEKLRVAVDWFSSPERVHREALGMRWLAELAPAGTITPLVFEDAARHVIAMRAVPRPHVNWKTMLLAGEVRDEHVRAFGEILGAIHRGSERRRDELAPLFDDRSFFESLRLEPYYGFAAEQVAEARGFLADLMAATRRHREGLVHGDYSPKNVLVRGNRLVLLDHEVIHFGDPAFDLGFALTHLLSKAHHVAGARDRFARAARLFWSAYRDARGGGAQTADFEPRAARHTLGCLLARVAGRSPLEYLDAAARERQRAAVVDLIARGAPLSIESLASAFLERV